MTQMTQAQFDACVKVYLRWQGKTPHHIMTNEGVEIVADEDYPAGGYYGIWVGGDPSDRGSMYLGIEPDGSTHS